MEIAIILTSILALVYFSYSAGKNKQTKEGQEDYIDATNKASNAKRNLTDKSRRLLWGGSVINGK